MIGWFIGLCCAVAVHFLWQCFPNSQLIRVIERGADYLGDCTFGGDEE